MDEKRKSFEGSFEWTDEDETTVRVERADYLDMLGEARPATVPVPSFKNPRPAARMSEAELDGVDEELTAETHRLGLPDQRYERPAKPGDAYRRSPRGSKALDRLAEVALRAYYPQNRVPWEDQKLGMKRAFRRVVVALDQHARETDPFDG